MHVDGLSNCEWPKGKGATGSLHFSMSSLPSSNRHIMKGNFLHSELKHAHMLQVSIEKTATNSIKQKIQQKLVYLMMAALPNELGPLEKKLCFRTIIPLR